MIERCDNTASLPVSEASTLTTDPQRLTGWARIGADVNHSLRALKAWLASEVQENSTLGQVCLVRGDADAL